VTWVEIVEIKDHPWFVGCQFHSGVSSPSPDIGPIPWFQRFFIAAAVELHKIAFDMKLNILRARVAELVDAYVEGRMPVRA